jgi:uncharacterized protein YhjY with autotransporter beta-barrel domain
MSFSFVRAIVARSLTLLICLVSLGPPAFSDTIEIVDTGLIGSEGVDLFTNNSPLTPNATYEINDVDLYDPLLTRATGIDGLGGDDQIINNASVTSTSNATVDIPLKFSSTESTAESTGITGGAGDDVLTNHSLLQALAESRSVVTEFLLQIDIGVTGWPTESTATAVGMTGDSGVDTVTNTSIVEAHSTAYSQADKIRVDSVNIPADTFGLGDASTTATATATGLAAGTEGPGAALEGVEAIENSGSVTANASSTATTQQMAVELIGSARIDDQTTATATATGIAGSGRDNLIDNTGSLDVDAVAYSELLSGELKMSGLMIKGALDQFGVDVGKANTTATADGVGIDGGGGDDTITSLEAEDNVDVYAEATALSVEATLSVNPGLGGGASAAAAAPLAAAAVTQADNTDSQDLSYADADTRAGATAVGMAGGEGDDTVNSAALVTAEADATATSVGVMVDASFSDGPMAYFPLPGAAIVDAKTDANAAAIGFDGGVGTDTITNDGTLNAISTADAETVTVGLTVKGVTKGFAGAVTVADSSSHATATATGIEGGDGIDTLTNSGTLLASSTATDDATTIDASVAVSTEGLVAGITIADSSSNASAVSMGMSGGTGQDTITNSGGLTSYAEADSDALTVGVSVAGTKVGVVAGVTVADASSDATATSTGIGTQSGGNTIVNEGALAATAIAHDDASSIGVTLAGAKAGIVAGVALADATATSTATSVGIDALDPEPQPDPAGDDIYTAGGLTATATATATDVAVAATLNAALQGVVGGGAAIEGDGTANAFATGVRTGAGGDTVTSEDEGGIAATSTATTTSTNVAVTMNAAWEGVALGAAVADTTTEATAGADGVSTGAGIDTITNAATLTSSATASATSNTITITVAVAPKGVSAGFAMSTSETQSEATAEGISSGEGDDTITNSALVDVDATATTNTKTITLNFAEVGAAIADVTSLAEAAATGIDVGSGSDGLRNSAAVDVTATATADDTAGTANFVGHASGDVTSEAVATAVGINNATGASEVESVDTITNDYDGSIAASAHATVDAENYVVQGGGAAFADTGAESDAVAVGIAGDVGEERITNSGLVAATAVSEADATSFNFELVGVQLGAAGVNATGTAAGIDGSGGANRIHNTSTGAIQSYASVDTLAGSVTGGFGLNVAVSGVTADVRSSGILTGADADWITNDGLMDVSGAAYGNAGAGSIGLFSLTMAYSLGSLTLDGISAGGGDDLIENTGSLNVGQLRLGDTALVKADSEAVSFDYFGLVTSGLSATGTVTGIAGGAGENTIVNGGILTVGDHDQWMAIGEAYAASGQIAGWNTAHAGSTGTMTATGIHGGRDLDTIINDLDGMITVDSRSYAEVEADAYLTAGFLGGITAKSSGYANGYATGIEGAAGDDLIGNAGGVLARATTYAYSDSWANISVDFWASANAKSNGDATAVATGIGAGTGANTVENTGSVGALATAYARGYGDSSSAFENNLTELRIRSVAEASGIAAGDGGNTVINGATGLITATATAATTDPSGGVPSAAYGDKTSTGLAGTSALLPVLADANGVELGAGDDFVYNGGDIAADAGSSAVMYVNTNVWYRYPTSTATAFGAGEATGIDAGAGDNTVVNNGTLGVVAAGYAMPSVDSWSRDYRATAKTIADSNATATGISADGSIINTADGTIDVTARAASHAWANTSAENVTANADLVARAVGITPASDTLVPTAHQLRNDGWLSVLAAAGEDDLGNVHESAYVDTDVWVRSDNGHADVNLNADGAGIRVGGAPTEITNTGDILVQARARPYTRAFVDSRDYRSYAYANAEAYAYARGIHATDGQHVITNTGRMDVRTVVHDAYTQADTWSSWSSCYSEATTFTHGTAVGIRTARGDDTIFNGGPLTVIADTDAVSYAWADTRDNNLADEDEISFAMAFAKATGIGAGAGVNTIINTGPLDVFAIATPEARYGGGHASVFYVESGQAYATGIRVGAGGSLIYNADAITVRSAADGRTSGNESATGIAGGAGPDTIVNEGTIAALIYSSPDALRASLPGVPESGALAPALSEPIGGFAIPSGASLDVGIKAGAGKDTVLLGDGSSVWGTIDLGDDDDTLTVIGSASVTGGGDNVAVDAGTGADQVHLSGSFRVNGAIELGEGDDLLTLADEAKVFGVVVAGAGADTVRVADRGDFYLEKLETSEHFQMDQGTLQVGSGVIVPANGTFRAEIYDGGSGQLLVDGTADLDGEATVIARPRVYSDGDVFPLLSAQAIQNQFASVILPPDSALVSFDSRYRFGILGRDLFEVLVDVDPFDSLGTNRLQQAVARYLDQVVPRASGDLEGVLRAFQLLPADADFDTAFTSLSPDQYDGSTLTGIDTQRQYLRGLQRRMETARARRQLGVKATSLASLQFAMAGSSSSVLTLAGALQRVSLPGEDARYTVWVDGLGQFGDQDRGNGFSGFDYSMGGGSAGIDRGFGEQFIAGLNAGYTYTDIDFNKGRGDSDIGAIHGSLYGTWFTDEARGYVEGVLSYARQDYDNRRRVVVGDLSRVAKSDHDANVFGAQLGGGYRFDLEGFGLRPFVSLSYVLLDEEGFTETGAGDVNLVVDGRTTNSLVSELGVRGARAFEPGFGTFVPYLSGAWKYDFDIDDRTIVSGFSGTPGTAFPVDGRDIDSHAALVGAGVLLLRDSWSASVEYLGEFRGDGTAHGIFARVGVAF